MKKKLKLELEIDEGKYTQLEEKIIGTVIKEFLLV